MIVALRASYCVVLIRFASPIVARLDSSAGSRRSAYPAVLHACWLESHGFSPCHASQRLAPYHRVSGSRCSPSWSIARFLGGARWHCIRFCRLLQVGERVGCVHAHSRERLFLRAFAFARAYTHSLKQFRQADVERRRDLDEGGKVGRSLLLLNPAVAYAMQSGLMREVLLRYSTFFSKPF